jgi:hypothetical protein
MALKRLMELSIQKNREVRGREMHPQLPPSTGEKSHFIAAIGNTCLR